VLRDRGLPTPDFLLVERMQDLEGLSLAFPLFAKPVAEGTSKGIDARSVLRTPGELSEVCERLLVQHGQGVLVEEFLPGRELTVGILGTGARARPVGTLEVSLLAGADREVYTLRNKEACESLVRYDLVEDELARSAERLALEAWRALGCRDGGRVDLRCDAAGRPQILEVNPLPGMHPTHSDLPILWQQSGRPYRELVAEILRSALEGRGVKPLSSCAS
jgi:D-alanine-D-alanine ligase